DPLTKLQKYYEATATFPKNWSAKKFKCVAKEIYWPKIRQGIGNNKKRGGIWTVEVVGTI
ncbi:MAG: hypothetical protein VX704_07365, partial [Verrucomicrobiota bacterium]|nr:hypothetical protein [Verrucomicrobiota bacterium]